MSRLKQVRLFFFGIDFEIGQTAVKRRPTDAEKARRPRAVAAGTAQSIEQTGSVFAQRMSAKRSSEIRRFENFRRQIIGLDHCAPAAYHGKLYCASELAHVAGPWVTRKQA